MTAGAIDNAGRIFVASNDATSVGNALTVFGTYNGLGGSIYLRTDLGPDNSPSDKLIIGGSKAVNAADGPAQAIGNTLLHVTPGPNSPGASTTANGILVIEAVKRRHDRRECFHTRWLGACRVLRLSSLPGRL
ncbi:autotransporter outer membrane beta-barrel domain-containing protein [Bradyrhizobium sp. BWA-3-5]|uniref:autotransporter outer membrane beta-barrel domain-containing protein n=1 Tax=Bradyrhizobium sp. BWA-3-5 TaxID=3080013 RepID=UPI00293E39A2|nr:autotransporter outer membrane beta-barrel domain-containing protein [Bradyrhizobium sp. BWA-3-5]WOH65140.1 autotransporter outer membrane beta-barrel domain-containing protein [Bradyrhizobium sp. BWA-3-5]